MREPTRVDIVPLSFAPNSKGADLGHRLTAYPGKDFTRLLTEALGPGPDVERTFRGDELLGIQWNCLLIEALMSHFSTAQLGRIHLLENTIIFEDNPKIEAPNPYSDDFNDTSDSLQSGPPFVGPEGQSISGSNTPTHGYTLTPTLWDTFPSNSTNQSTPSGQEHGVFAATHKASLSASNESLFSPFKTVTTKGYIPSNGTWKQEQQIKGKWKQEEQQIKGKLKKATSMPGTLNDALPKFPKKLDKPIVLQKTPQAKSELSIALEAAVAAKYAEIWSVENSGPVPNLQTTAIRQKCFRIFVERLARAFTDVYEAYERYQFDEAVSAGLPPPVKKLRLASGTAATSEPSKEIPIMRHYRPDTIHLTEIASSKPDAKGIEVLQPYLHPGSEDFDEDNDADSTAAYFFAGKTIFLARRMCTTPLGASLTVPQHVYWRDSKKITDDCPKCRRVLFKRAR
ncbi:hypothetical protein N0V90_008461 [Kalmusia sp. IMI 367209]|nr:hypothetical protein N0V90_008461 [Kalmusia sp. IMI 367209]